MDNKLIYSLCDREKFGLKIENIIDIINLYGNKYVDGIEINTLNLDNLKLCAKLCKKNNLLFRCHFPSEKMEDIQIIKYLNCINEISKELRYRINVVFHSLSYEDTIDEMVADTKIYISKIIAYIEKYKLNITFTLENLNYLNGVKRINLSRIDELLELNEKVYFTYDIGHDTYDNKKLSKLSNLQKARIRNVHIHSVINNEDHHSITSISNDLDLIKEAILELKTIDYQEPIVLEYALDYMEGKNYEQKAISIVKAFKFFKEELMK